MENIYKKVSTALNEEVLGCRVQKIKRDANARQSISYLLHPSIAIQHANDCVTHIEHEVQVDIWSDIELSIHELTSKVIKLMRDNGFMLISVRSDIFESETNIIHKPVIFSYIENLRR